MVALGRTSRGMYFARMVHFHAVTKEMFISFLKNLKSQELIDQDTERTILLGRVGEKIVNHYSFFTAFLTPEEYRIVTESRELGTLPISFPLTEGMLIIFAGRRWRVLEIREEQKEVLVTPAKGGRPPLFSGGAGFTDDTVRKEMFTIYSSSSVPAYLDPGARRLLEEGRETFQRMGIARTRIISQGANTLVLPWCGDRVMNTLVLLLQSSGFTVGHEGLAVLVENARPEAVRTALRQLCAQQHIDAAVLAENVPNKCTQKYDCFLPEELLCRDYASQSLWIENIDAVIHELLLGDQQAK